MGRLAYKQWYWTRQGVPDCFSFSPLYNRPMLRRLASLVFGFVFSLGGISPSDASLASSLPRTSPLHASGTPSDAPCAAGDIAQAMGWEEGSAEKIALHAGVGAFVAAINDGDIALSAGAAGLNEALLPYIAAALDEAGLEGVVDKDALLILTSQALGGLIGGSDGAAITGSATENNYLLHPRDPTEEEREDIYSRLEDCGDDEACRSEVIEDAKTISELFAAETELALCDGDSTCKAKVTDDYLALSRQRNVDWAACQTSACVDQHLKAFARTYMSSSSYLRESAALEDDTRALASGESGQLSVGMAGERVRLRGQEVCEGDASCLFAHEVYAHLSDLGAGIGAGGISSESSYQGKGAKNKTETTKGGGANTEKTNGANKVATTIAPKIEKQMGKRGWDRASLDETISNPHRTVTTRDTRHNPNTGSRNNDPAIAYINSDGSYVVRNSKTGDIVQVSDRTDPNWKSPFE